MSERRRAAIVTGAAGGIGRELLHAIRYVGYDANLIAGNFWSRLG